MNSVATSRLAKTAAMSALLAASCAAPQEAPAQATNRLSAERASGPDAVRGASYDALLTQISQIAEASKGSVGVAAIHLRTGASVEFNADEAVSLASTFKVPLAAYAMHLAEAGKLSLTEPVALARKDMIEPGVLYDHFRHAGTMISLLNAIELSVSISDNSATDVIFRRVGGPAAANAWLRARGYPRVNVGRQLLKDLFAEPSGSSAAQAVADSSALPSPTPRAVVKFLADLHGGRIINASHTRTLLDIMSRTIGERLSVQLPPGAKVLHKTGTTIGDGNATVNDIGYIQLPDGGWVAIGVYIKDSPLEVSHGTRDRVIGGISRSIYDYFVLTAR